MAPPRKIVPSIQVRIFFPADTWEKVEKYLTSSATGKVRKGAYQEFFTARAEEFFRALESSGNRLLQEMSDESGSDE